MTPELNRTVSDNTVNGLELALASTAVATAKAQNFHWNVTGMAFAPLHALFEEIYAEHFEAQDTFAERIRMLGRSVDGRQSEQGGRFAQLASERMKRTFNSEWLEP
jgi:starvation-inducible DNA-binding protein